LQYKNVEDCINLQSRVTNLECNFSNLRKHHFACLNIHATYTT
jgi:hypothetical protein